jgi:phospholipid/cholesterol/gamma-HCH transport system ATP-binding protein
VQEALDIVDYVYYMSDGKMVAHGTPEEMRAMKEPLVHQFVYGEADGPVPFQYPSKQYAEDLRLGARHHA